MDSRTVIDLTGDDDTEPSAPKQSKASTSQQQSSTRPNGHPDSGTSQQRKPKGRQRSKKSRENSAQPEGATGDNQKINIPLVQRIQPAPVNGSKANASSNNIPKRKRRGSVDSINTVRSNAEEARPPPPKRLKSDEASSSVPTRNNNAPTRRQRKRNNGKQEGKETNESRQAPSTSSAKESGEIDDGPSSSKPPSKSNSRKNKHTSESPKPTSTVHQANGKKGRKGTPRARSASVPASEDLFFVDTEPNKENKYEEETVKPTFKIVSGNLLLPEHVLLETAEEAVETPGKETYPPASPASSQGSIDLIDDTARVRPYCDRFTLS